MSTQQQRKSDEDTSVRKVLTDKSGGANLKPEKPELSPLDCEALQNEYDLVIGGFRKWIEQLRQSDLGSFQPYLDCRDRIKTALADKQGLPQEIRKDLAQLERLFRECWNIAMSARKVREDKFRKDLREAETELSDLKRLIEKKDMALSEARKSLKAKGDQIEVRENNVREGKVKAKELGEYKLKTNEVKAEKTLLEETTVPGLLEELEELPLKLPAANDTVAAARKKLEPLETARVSWEKGIRKRAADVEARIRVLVKDTEKPDRFRNGMDEVSGLLSKTAFIDVEWILAELEKAVDEEERFLRENYADRAGFFEILLPLETRAKKIEESQFGREMDSERIGELLEQARGLAKARKYAEASGPLKNTELLASEAEKIIEHATKAHPIYEKALHQALAQVEQYESGNNVVDEELSELNRLVAHAEAKAEQMAFGDAINLLERKFTPLALQHLEAQTRWKEKTRKERKPPLPPDYNKAADWIVDQVLQSFMRKFHYAGGSVSLTNYPPDRYIPSRLKRMVRARFAALQPHIALPGLGLSPACYFNLGSGGTTKLAIEYNVKVKLPGEMEARAQVHVEYH